MGFVRSSKHNGVDRYPSTGSRSPVEKRRHSYRFSNTCTLPSDPIPVIVFASSDTVVMSVKVVLSALASKS
jgi:hypothetical protein